MTDPRELTYPACVRPDSLTDGSFVYIAEHPDLPGCVAYGRTLREARENLDGARHAYLTQLIEEGASVPSPSQKYATVEWETTTGAEPGPQWEADDPFRDQLSGGELTAA